MAADDTETPQHTPVREAARPWERIYIAFFIGVFLTALVSVPVSMYGLEALKSNLRLVAMVVLTFLLAIAFLFGLFFLFRRNIARRFGLPPPGLLRDVYDPLVEGLEALRNGDLQVAYVELKDSAAAAVSFYGWLTVRWWMVSTSLALIGVFTAVAGTALLFRQNDLLFDQNRLIVDQNRKIKEQALVLRVQNQLMFAQADVEVSRQFDRMRDRMRSLRKLSRTLSRASELAAAPLSVRYGDPGGDCSSWKQTSSDTVLCALADVPKDGRCSDVTLRELRRGWLSAGEVQDEHRYAFRALSMLSRIERSIPVQTLDQDLRRCDVEENALDAYERDLQVKRELGQVLYQLVTRRNPDVGPGALAPELAEASVQQLHQRLREVHDRLLGQARAFGERCGETLAVERAHYQEKRRQHQQLAEAVMKKE